MTAIDDVRDWVGSEPDDATVLETLDRFAAITQPVERAALVILRRRRADLYGDRSFAVAGDYSQTAASVENVKALTASIARLEGLVDGEASPPATMTSTTLYGRTVAR